MVKTYIPVTSRCQFIQFQFSPKPGPQPCPGWATSVALPGSASTSTWGNDGFKKKDSNWSGSILKWIQIQTAIWNDFRSHSFLVLHSQAQLEDLRVSIFWVRNLFPNHQDSRCWGHILFLKEQIEQIPLFSVNQLLYQYWGPLTCLVTCPKT